MIDSSSLCEDKNKPTPLLLSEENPRESLFSSADEELFILSEKKFACNAQSAFEELSRLHRKRNKLHEHELRGDANRARSQTIDRKANAAEAAETAFRTCIGVMMPELLEFWDDKKKRNQIHSKWDDSRENAIDGVTFDTLEQTAEELDRTV